MKISMTQDRIQVLYNLTRRTGHGGPLYYMYTCFHGLGCVLSHGTYRTPGALYYVCPCSGVCVIIIPPFVYSSDTRRAEYPEHSS